MKPELRDQWLAIIAKLLEFSLFWLIWTIGGIGQKYFYWIPETYQKISFWECIGLFIVISILKNVLIPKFISRKYKDDKNA